MYRVHVVGIGIEQIDGFQNSTSYIKLTLAG